MIIFKVYFYFRLPVCLSVYVYMHESAVDCRGQKRASNLLELEIQEDVCGLLNINSGNQTQILCKSSVHS